MMGRRIDYLADVLVAQAESMRESADRNVRIAHAVRLLDEDGVYFQAV